MSEPVDERDVMALLVGRVQDVMALDTPPPPAARFDEDLHADSLDLVEIVEGVEQALRERGVKVKIADEQLLGLRTVEEAAGAIARAAEDDEAPA